MASSQFMVQLIFLITSLHVYTSAANVTKKLPLPTSMFRLNVSEKDYETTVYTYTTKSTDTLVEPLPVVKNACGELGYDAILATYILEFQVVFYPAELVQKLNGTDWQLMEIQKVRVLQREPTPRQSALSLDERWQYQETMGFKQKATIRFYCKTEKSCMELKNNINLDPKTFQRNIYVHYTVIYHSRIANKFQNSPKLSQRYSYTQKRTVTYMGNTKAAIKEMQEKKTQPHSVEIATVDQLQFTKACTKGWVLIQRRVSDEISFYRTRIHYENGFGNQHSNYWRGLNKIHQLTQMGVQLRIELWTKNNEFLWTEYQEFKVRDRNSDYEMSIGAMEAGSTGGDAMSIHSGARFSTFDRDKDSGGFNCAQRNRGAWWFKKCDSLQLNPNGEFQAGRTNATAVYWTPINGKQENLKEIRFLILL